MGRFRSISGVTALLLALSSSACANDTSDPGPSAAVTDTVAGFDVSPGGAADGSSFVIDAAFGESYTGHLEPLPPGSDRSLEDMEGHMAILRLRLVDDATFAVVLRRTGGSLDPFLIVRDRADFDVSHDDQAVLPMAEESDALTVINGTAGADYVIFGSDRELAQSGDYRIDVIGLDVPTVDFGVTNAGLRAVTDILRTNEPTLAGYLADGVLVEEVDGSVSIDSGGAMTLPLAERASLNGFVSNLNTTRTTLFEQILYAHSLEVTDEAKALVGQGMAQVWWGARRAP